MESKGIQKSPKEFKRFQMILKIPRKSKRFQKNPKDSKKIQKNSSEWQKS